MPAGTIHSIDFARDDFLPHQDDGDNMSLKEHAQQQSRCQGVFASAGQDGKIALYTLYPTQGN